MVNYSQGKIYKIVCNITGEIYIGSTCEKYLSSRLSGHKVKFRMWKNGKTNYITSFKIIERGYFEIQLIESVDCKNVYELRNRERFHIESNECVNKCIPNRTGIEYRETHKNEKHKYDKQYNKDNKDKIAQYQKQYYIDNKCEILHHNKQWREKNKDKISQQGKEYREKNKDKISQQRKQYREKNKERIKQQQKQKFSCECGSIVRKSDKSQHFKSQRHRNYMKTDVKCDTINLQVNCVCGGTYVRSSRARHFKTKKHQTYIKQQEA